MSAPSELKPHHIIRRIGDGRILSLADQFEFMNSGELLGNSPPLGFATAWSHARADRFGSA
jgi:hypothetical protein